MWLLDRAAIGVEVRAYAGYWAFLANTLVPFCGWLILTALIRRPLVSLLLVSGLQAALYLAAAMKLKILATPLSLSDMYFVTAISPEIITLLGSYLELPGGPWPWLLGLLGLLLLIIALERPSPALRGLRRHAMLLAGLILVATLYLGSWPWPGLYSQDRLRPSPYGSLLGILHGGHIAALVFEHLENQQTTYTVDEAKLRQALQMAGAPAKTAASPLPQPDIIVVLSESFMDPRTMSGFEQVPDLIPEVRAAIHAGRGGMMRVPTYGGGTVRTEFEILTGMPVGAFPKLRYPYVELRPRRMPGLASTLASQGYRTIAIHPNASAFWNRSDTFRAMGFERFIAQPEFERSGVRDGLWYSDQSLTDMLLESLEQQDDTPSFILAISMETHGPYLPDAVIREPEARAAIMLPATLPEQFAATTRTYLYHLQNADRQFARLHRALEARKRPYVLLFFGDHLPGLELHQQITFVDGKPATAQQVPWVLLSNTGAAPPDIHLNPAFSWQMPALVLAQAGIQDPWFDFILKSSRKLNQLHDDEAKFVTLAQGVHAGALARFKDQFETYLQ